MRAVQPMNTLLVIFFLILSGCQQHSDPINMVVLKGTMGSMPTTLSPKSVSSTNKRYKSVAIEQSSGNAMRDALEILFAENELETYYTSLQLVASSKANGESIYSFHGKALSKTALAKAGLAEYFTIKVGRDKEGLQYSIEFQE